MRDDDFDLEKLKLSDDMPPPQSVRDNGKPRQRRHGQFIKVPLEWMHRLESARVTATYRVALHLLHEDFKARGRENKIRLANGALESVTPRQKWRALSELEKLGLIEIEHRLRRSPLVTLLDPKDD